MNFARLLAQILWVLPLVLQAAIALVMFWRKQVTLFPVFFCYTVVVLSREFLLLFLNQGNLYALIYWCTEALAIVLGFAVIFEILGHIVPASPALRYVLNSIWILAAIAAVTSLLILFLTNGTTGADRVFEFIILAERSVRLLQAFLLIVVIALMSRLGLTWHNVPVGIVAGFGIYSALALVGWELRAHLHVISHATFVLLNSAAYNLAAVIWAFYILRPWRGIPVEHLPKANLAEWNNAVSEYVNQWYRRY
jgi:hypothetical protein